MDSMIIPVINKLLCAEPPLFSELAIVFFTAYFLNYLTFLVINIFCIYFFKNVFLFHTHISDKLPLYQKHFLPHSGQVISAILIPPIVIILILYY